MRKAHEGRGHTFIGTPIARCVEPDCKEKREVSPYPVSFGVRNQIGGGSSWASTQIGEDPYETRESGMGRYADEGEVDPQGFPSEDDMALDAENRYPQGYRTGPG